MLLRRHVTAENGNHIDRVENTEAVGMPKVEKIAPLASLIECAQFRAQKLRCGVNRNPGRSLIPAGIDPEFAFCRRMNVEMLAGIDLDFQAKGDHRRRFGGKSEKLGGTTRARFGLGCAQPRFQCSPQPIECGTYRNLLHLDKVEVFGVSGSWTQE